MKEIEWKLLSELMKNSRRSDRELARAMHTSQPTVTRARNKLEKEGYIKEYAVIPNFCKLGYEILALTFVKPKKGLTAEELTKVRKMGSEIEKEMAFEVIMAVLGAGLGYDGVIVSLHKNYTSYAELIKK